jgi:cytochrome c
LTAQGARADGDPAAGEQVFHKCAICHSPEKGVNKVGPSLWGVVGRKAGTLPDYNYDDAMKNSGKTWDPETLNAYLADPRGYLPGVKMLFPGLKDEKDRQNVIAYLETLK